jgi:hypothetical protein
MHEPEPDESETPIPVVQVTADDGPEDETPDERRRRLARDRKQRQRERGTGQEGATLQELQAARATRRHAVPGVLLIPGPADAAAGAVVEWKSYSDDLAGDGFDFASWLRAKEKERELPPDALSACVVDETTTVSYDFLDIEDIARAATLIHEHRPDLRQNDLRRTLSEQHGRTFTLPPARSARP